MITEKSKMRKFISTMCFAISLAMVLIIYANKPMSAKAAEGIPIKSVSISGIPKPITGQPCTFEGLKISTDQGDDVAEYAYDITEYCGWMDMSPNGDRHFEKGDRYIDGRYYQYRLTIKPKEGYYFAFDEEDNRKYTGTITCEYGSPGNVVLSQTKDGQELVVYGPVIMAQSRLSGTITADAPDGMVRLLILDDKGMFILKDMKLQLVDGTCDYSIDLSSGTYGISAYMSAGNYFSDTVMIDIVEGEYHMDLNMVQTIYLPITIQLPEYSGGVVAEIDNEGNVYSVDLWASEGTVTFFPQFNKGQHITMKVKASGFADCELSFIAGDDSTITIDMIKNQKLTHTLSVQNNLAINYYIAQSAIPNLTNVVLNIEKDVYDTNGVKTIDKTVLLSKLGDYGYGPEYKFVYEGVASYQAINEIRASLTGECNGVKYTFAPDVYSIETYCYNQIGKSSVAAKTKKLLVDLLNYCSASQVHFGIKADTLANRNLTSAQKALGTTTAPALADISGTKSLAGTTARFNGKTLVLGNNVELKIYVLLDDSVQKENVSLRIKYQNVNGENVVAYVPYSEFSYDSDRNEYSAKYTGLIAPEFRKELQLTVMEGTKEISDTDTYAIETYAYNRVNGSSKQTLKDVVTEMMKYSDSALAYFK